MSSSPAATLPRLDDAITRRLCKHHFTICSVIQRLAGIVREGAFATVIAAAALLVCILRAACVPAWANDDDPHAILFSGRDIWLNGAFAHGGFLFAPSGLDQDGLLLKILFSGGLYRYDAKNLGGQQRDRRRRTRTCSRRVAGQTRRCGIQILLRTRIPEASSPAGRSIKSACVANSIGLRMAVEFWYEPSPNSMVAADASLSSIATSNSARIAYGWRVFEEMLGGVYLGPDHRIFRLGRIPASASGCSRHQHEDRGYRMVGCRRLGTGFPRPSKSLSAARSV